MNLTDHQLKILAEVDFKLGPFVIASSACDINGTNHFIAHAEYLKDIQDMVDEFETELKVFEALTPAEQEKEMLEFCKEKDAVLNNTINANRETMKNLSKSAEELMNTAAEGKIDPQHMSENTFLTEILESITTLKTENADLTTKLIGTPDVEMELLKYEQELRKSIDDGKLKLVTAKRNALILENRVQWVKDTFGLDDKEVEDLQKTYGAKANKRKT